MSEKVELTIRAPSLNLRSKDGRIWRPFDVNAMFPHGGVPGVPCSVCSHLTPRGWTHSERRRPFRVTHLCPDCVTLINPWEAANE